LEKKTLKLKNKRHEDKRKMNQFCFIIRQGKVFHSEKSSADSSHAGDLTTQDNTIYLWKRRGKTEQEKERREKGKEKKRKEKKRKEKKRKEKKR
jgi:hypothetical protein